MQESVTVLHNQICLFMSHFKIKMKLIFKRASFQVEWFDEFERINALEWLDSLEVSIETETSKPLIWARELPRNKKPQFKII